jgi:hypothetical protein
MRFVRLHRAAQSPSVVHQAPVETPPAMPAVEYEQEDVPMPLLDAVATFERDIGTQQTLRVRVKSEAFELVITPKRDHRGDISTARIEQKQ